MEEIARGIATGGLTLQSVLLPTLVYKGVLTPAQIHAGTRAIYDADRRLVPCVP